MEIEKLIFLIAVFLLLIYRGLYAFSKQKIKTVLQKNHITVTGTAQNEDGFAKVVVDEIDCYCMEGFNAWRPDWINKKIKVIGDLEVRAIHSSSKKNTNEIKLIKSAVVQLISKDLVY